MNGLKNHPEQELPVTVNETVSETKEEETEKVQPIVLDSPSGTYVVLQRMQQNNSKETLTKIKNMGVKGFRKYVNTFMEQNKAWTPPSTDDNNPEWYQQGVDEALKDPAKVARFIHGFFKN